jgi:GTP-binding protein
MVIEHIRFHSAKFTLSARCMSQCPVDNGSEVAFAGRSNAGKSSAINTLTCNPRLARTSKTPGRTQLMNFFDLNVPQTRLVDLPGYGYAKVPDAMKKAWQRRLYEYLEQRLSLRGLVLVMDIRHPMKPFDQMLIAWAIAADMPLHLLLTKADKLKRGAINQSLLKVRQSLPSSSANLISIQAFSALKGDGIQDLERQLLIWLRQTAETHVLINPH